MMLVMGSIGIPSYAQDQEILETVEESISESNEVDGPDAESEEPDRDVKEEEVEKTVEQEERRKKQINGQKMLKKDARQRAAYRSRVYMATATFR